MEHFSTGPHLAPDGPCAKFKFDNYRLIRPFSPKREALYQLQTKSPLRLANHRRRYDGATSTASFSESDHAFFVVQHARNQVRRLNAHTSISSHRCIASRDCRGRNFPAHFSTSASNDCKPRLTRFTPRLHIGSVFQHRTSLDPFHANLCIRVDAESLAKLRPLPSRSAEKGYCRRRKPCAAVAGHRPQSHKCYWNTA